LIVSFDIFFEYFYGYNILGFTNETGYTGRIASFFKDELIVGSFVLAFTIPIFSYLYLNSKFKFSIFFLILTATAIIFSGERSNSLKIIFGLILILYFWNYKNYYKKYILSIVATLFILISVIPITKNNDFIKHNIIHKYITTTLNIVSIDKEISLKQNLMESRYINQGIFSYEILKENIFFGVGNKNYFKACRKYVAGYERNLCFTHPHQTYYELLSEHGLIGSFIIIFIFIYLIFFNKTKNLSNNTKKKISIFRIYLIFAFLPLIPSGSFFSSLVSSLFWINYAFYTIYRNKLISEENEKY
jgi:O-antigen ligase